MSFASNQIQFETLEEPTNIELKELVGEGTYGEVYAALDLSNEDGELKYLGIHSSFEKLLDYVHSLI